MFDLLYVNYQLLRHIDLVFKSMTSYGFIVGNKHFNDETGLFLYAIFFSLYKHFDQLLIKSYAGISSLLRATWWNVIALDLSMCLFKKISIIPYNFMEILRDNYSRSKSILFLLVLFYFSFNITIEWYPAFKTVISDDSESGSKISIDEKSFVLNTISGYLFTPILDRFLERWNNTG